MEVFACVCEALRADDFRRLRTYAAEPVHRARFGTWLVSVLVATADGHVTDIVSPAGTEPAWRP